MSNSSSFSVWEAAMVIASLRHVTDGDVKYDAIMLWCPGCATHNDNGLHMLPVTDTSGKRPQWTWNGSLTEPDLKPSILTKMGDVFVCHSYLNNGIWDFLTDSTHSLSGQKVPVVELPDWVLGGDDDQT